MKVIQTNPPRTGNVIFKMSGRWTIHWHDGTYKSYWWDLFKDMGDYHLLEQGVGE